MPTPDESYDSKQDYEEDVVSMHSPSETEQSTRRDGQSNDRQQSQSAARDRSYEATLQQTERTQSPASSSGQNRIRSQRLANRPTGTPPSATRTTRLSLRNSVMPATLSLPSTSKTQPTLEQNSRSKNSPSTKALKISPSLRGTDDCSSVVKNGNSKKRKRSEKFESPNCKINVKKKTKQAKSNLVKISDSSYSERLPIQTSPTNMRPRDYNDRSSFSRRHWRKRCLNEFLNNGCRPCSVSLIRLEDQLGQQNQLPRLNLGNMPDHGAENQAQMPSCSTADSSKKSKRSNGKRCSTSRTGSDSSEKSFVCPYCNKIFSSEGTLDRHIRNACN